MKTIYTWARTRFNGLKKSGHGVKTLDDVFDAWEKYLIEARKTKTTAMIAKETGISASALNRDLSKYGLNKRQYHIRNHITPCGCCTKNYEHKKWGNEEWQNL